MSPDLTLSRGIVFDLDDTLYPRQAYLDSAFRAVADHLSRSHGLAAEQVLSILRAAHASSARGAELQVLGERLGLAAHLTWQLREVMRAHAPRIRLPDVSLRLLGRLRAAGWRVGILTNGLPGVQRRKSLALGVGPLVDCIVYAEEHIRLGKPAPRAFRVAVERLRVEPARCVVVGDDPARDIAGARAAGIRAIWLRRGPADLPAPADAVVTSLAQVPAALAQLEEANVSSAA